MPTMLEVMQARVGIEEVPDAGNNPTIVGWASSVGWPSIREDATPWCSICMSSAALEAGDPMPPLESRPMARSWLQWGTKVLPEDAQPGDVVIWPRGEPWQGHVNIIEKITEDGAICIGGNQSSRKGGAVTRTKPQALGGAVGIRRVVRATVPELRKAGSTEIRKGDQVQNAGWLVTLIPSVIAAFNSLFGKVDVPQFADLKEGLGWWQEILGGVYAVAGLVQQHPWLAGTCLVGALLVLIGHQLKAARVAKAAAGVPLSSQVA
jgi:uncharacterized protein (TIGR02594 family)